MKCYRKLLKISCSEHRTSKSIREELICKETKAGKYFGHLKRSEGLGKIILEGKIDRKWERGRPRRQWERDIRDIFDTSLTEVGRLALDRDGFRCAVKDAPSNGISRCSSPRVPSLEYLYYKSEFLTVSVYFKADDWTRCQEHTFHNRLRKLCLLADNDTRLIYETVVEF